MSLLKNHLRWLHSAAVLTLYFGDRQCRRCRSDFASREDRDGGREVLDSRGDCDERRQDHGGGFECRGSQSRARREDEAGGPERQDGAAGTVRQSRARDRSGTERVPATAAAPRFVCCHSIVYPRADGGDSEGPLDHCSTDVSHAAAGNAHADARAAGCSDGTSGDVRRQLRGGGELVCAAHERHRPEHARSAARADREGRGMGEPNGIIRNAQATTQESRTRAAV